MLILIAGPYRSGTDGDPRAMAANLDRLEAAAWPVFAAGHIPVIGEWIALPVLRSAGAGPTDPLADEVLYPTAHRLLTRCDAVLRLPGESAGCRPGRRHRPAPRPARLLRGERHSSAYPVRGGVTTRPGVDAPDHRGRTGLDRAGRDLDRNPGVLVRDVELTSRGWHVLRRTTFDYRRRDGRWETQQRETYDRGNGAVVLPYDSGRGTSCSPGSSATRRTSTATPTACSSKRLPDCSTRTTRSPPSDARRPKSSASSSARSRTSSTPT